MKVTKCTNFFTIATVFLILSTVSKSCRESEELGMKEFEYDSGTEEVIDYYVAKFKFDKIELKISDGTQFPNQFEVYCFNPINMGVNEDEAKIISQKIGQDIYNSLDDGTKSVVHKLSVLTLSENNLFFIRSRMKQGFNFTIQNGELFFDSEREVVIE